MNFDIAKDYLNPNTMKSNDCSLSKIADFTSLVFTEESYGKLKYFTT